jgi:hypothetical protein
MWKLGERKLDDIVGNLDTLATGRLGREVPWDRGIYWATIALIILSCLVMIIRPDFLSACLAGGAYYVLLTNRRGTDNFAPAQFKMIAFGLLVSIVVDVVWFLFSGPHWASSALGDGLENPVKDISILLSVVNVFVKLAVAFAFWRNAIN